jgi:uncharacterized membrane protein
MVDLVVGLAWPVTILSIVLFLRLEIKMLAQTLAVRAMTDDIAFGNTISIKAPASVAAQARRVSFTKYVRSLTDAAILRAIAKQLGLPAAVTNSLARNMIIGAMAERVQTDGDMDDFSKRIKTITKQDF